MSGNIFSALQRLCRIRRVLPLRHVVWGPDMVDGDL